MPDDEAQLIVTETNLVQRSFADLLHSERAIALKMHMAAVKKQGTRHDLLNEVKSLSTPHENTENKTSGLIDPKSEARTQVGKKYDLD